MSIKIKLSQLADAPLWDAYVDAHPLATLYHFFGWRNIISKTYGHNTYYLRAIKYDSRVEKVEQLSAIGRKRDANQIVGILPLIHLKDFLFGNRLISIPFFDLGGILADNEEIERALLFEAIRLGRKLKVSIIELRHAYPLSWFKQINQQELADNSIGRLTYVTKSHKERMLLDLPDSSKILIKSFKSKLRSQIKRSVKEGLYSKIGGFELLEDFYRVFLINMRDLGSPVHSKGLFRCVLKEFSERAKVVVIYKNDQPMAGSLIIGFKNTLENPWASALRKYSRFSPNMLLYWSMLEYACDNGFLCFDFGRSSPGEGTYKFKQQWGAGPTTLYWHYVLLYGRRVDKEEKSEKSGFEKFIRCWQKLPVPVTRILGPMIRKHIGL